MARNPGAAALRIPAPFRRRARAADRSRAEARVGRLFAYNGAMPTKPEFEALLKEAMRSGDSLRKRTLRMILAAIKLAEVERRGPLDEPGLLGVLQKEARTRQEAIADAERAGRPDLVEDNRLELALIEGFLPQGLSAEELEALAKKAVSETGATGPGDLGRVMKALMPQVQGRADGKAVSELVRRLLSPA